MEANEKIISKQVVMLISAAIFLVVVLVLVMVSVALTKKPDDVDGNIATSDESSVSDVFDNSEISKENSFEGLNSSGEPDIEVSDDLSDDSADISEEESSEPEAEQIEHGWIINDYGYTYVYGDSGYQQFTYSTKVMDRYASSLNNLAEIIPSSVNLYNMAVPVSSEFAEIPREVYVEDDFYNKSQSAFVSTVETKLNERIINIPVVIDIREQYENGENVFFRTDNNWTALAAYTAYTKYCETAGINAYSLSSFPEIQFGEFLGRFYIATEQIAMKNNPDSFVYYNTLPSVKTSLTLYDYGTVYKDYSLCNNEADINTANSIYLGRSAGRYEINTTADGGSLLIIGDSSCYPMLPFLASHYRVIEVIDPQHFNGSIKEFIEGRQFNDVITMCYTTNATTGEYIPAFNTITGEQNNVG